VAESGELYGNISGGRVLDVATGRGGFVESLITDLKDYDEIIGIDLNGDFATGFAEKFADHPRISFQQVDAQALPFENESFDTVSVASSLHHLADPRLGLSEMRRVLRRHGHFIVVEMYRDGQTDTQQTHVILHHWWAAIDRLSGTVHRETYTRDEVVELIRELDLSELTMRDDTYLDEDPMEPEQLAQVESSIDRYRALAAGHEDLIAQGKVLRERLHRVGFHSATVLVALGHKP
jgi:ubiquinone/menaquinone biosynthesis C-methylase UbiE